MIHTPRSPELFSYLSSSSLPVLLGPFFDPGNGGGKLLRNLCRLVPDFTMLYAHRNEHQLPRGKGRPAHKA
jgi:hypothetical protein